MAKKKAVKKVTAEQVVKLLREKHAEDVFVPECKTGPSPCLRMDAWTMNRSWANARATAYEVKVSRSDFLNDKKWNGYLDYCNAFYFVAPAGVIKAEEIPESAGFIQVATTGTRLFTKKKAPFRQIDIPIELYMHLMMSRTLVTREYNHSNNRENRVRHWEEWLRRKHEAKDIGWRVSRKVRDALESMDRDRRNAINLAESYESLRKRLIELGFDPDVSVSRWQIDSEVAQLLGEIPSGFGYTLERAIRALQDTVREVEAMKDNTRRRKEALDAAD